MHRLGACSSIERRCNADGVAAVPKSSDAANDVRVNLASLITAPSVGSSEGPYFGKRKVRLSLADGIVT
jgi:hypothetical protein